MKNKTAAPRDQKNQDSATSGNGSSKKSNGNGNGNGNGKRPAPVRHSAMLPNQPSIEAILMGPGATATTARHQARMPIADTTPNESALTRGELLHVLMAFKKGDFSVRLPADLDGIDGKIADAFNEVIELNERMANELERLSRVVGKEGKLSQRAASAAKSPARGRTRPTA